MSALEVVSVWDWWEKAHHFPVEDDMHRQLAEDIFLNGAPEGAQIAHVSPNLITVHYGKDRVRWERWRRLDAAGKLPSDYARAALMGAARDGGHAAMGLPPHTRSTGHVRGYGLCGRTERLRHALHALLGRGVLAYAVALNPEACRGVARGVEGQ